MCTLLVLSIKCNSICLRSLINIFYIVINKTTVLFVIFINYNKYKQVLCVLIDFIHLIS